MRRIISLGVILVLLLTACLWAEDSIKAEVSKTSLTTQETLSYKITAIVFGNKMPEVKLPKFEGFSAILSLQSSRMSFTDNKIKKIITYDFILRPKEAGKFKIGPAILKIEDAAETPSDILEIEVKPDSPESEASKTTL